MDTYTDKIRAEVISALRMLGYRRMKPVAGSDAELWGKPVGWRIFTVRLETHTTTFVCRYRAADGSGVASWDSEQVHYEEIPSRASLRCVAHKLKGSSCRACLEHMDPLEPVEGTAALNWIKNAEENHGRLVTLCPGDSEFEFETFDDMLSKMGML